MRIDDERSCAEAAGLFRGGRRSVDRALEASAGPCLSEEAISSFSEGRSSPRELELLHAHLDVCVVCLDLVNAAIHGWELPPALAPRERPWLATFGAGQTIARRYRIERLLGRGGMGEVYLAFDELLGERVALKMVLPTASDSPAAVARLLNEVRLARRISHANVCRVHDIGVHEEPGRVDDRLFFITMEYVEGERLGQLARSAPLAVSSVLGLARQILAGLRAAHGAGVLHRDLKSDNVMVRRAGAVQQVRIMDFGLSARLDQDGGRTSARERVGSASYMAPEQLQGLALGPATDLFAFGVVLFEMLCGTLPFASEGSATQRAPRRIGERAVAPSALRPELGPTLDRFVLRCLMEKPEDRFASADEALAELREGSGELGGRSGRSARGAPRRAPGTAPAALRAR
jgi:eukaryotic-like serine/threonine-protein kinase